MESTYLTRYKFLIDRLIRFDFILILRLSLNKPHLIIINNNVFNYPNKLVTSGFFSFLFFYVHDILLIIRYNALKK